MLQVVLMLCVVAAAFDAGAGLVAHWPLAGDANDASGNGLHGINHGVVFDAGMAWFDGRGAYIEVPDDPRLRLGSSDFTVSLSLHTEADLDDTLGDLLSKFDPESRKGLNLGLMSYHGVVNAQSNYRNLFVGLDDGSAPGAWKDCGRPGNAIYIMALCVYDGDLYAGTFEIGKDESGHVYRYAGGDRWEDCGSPFPSNAVSALAVHDGALYVAASHYRSGGSAMANSENTLHGGRVFRYRGGTEWEDCGKLGEIEAIYGLTTFKGRLYASSLYAPAGFFRYEGGTTWTDLGTAGGRVEALGVHNGHIYGTGFDENFAGVSRFDDPGWTYFGEPPDTTQTYSFMQYQGALFVGSWPSGKVFELEGPGVWTDRGQLGEEKESMGMAVYNGMLYAGTLPLAQVYRYDGGTTWTNTGQLDTTPDATYRRAWSMAVFQGALYCGVLPSGRVHRLATGRCLSYDREVPAGRVHVAVTRGGGNLTLYLNGDAVVARSEDGIDIANENPLRIGFGQHDYFNGGMQDLRIYDTALDAGAVRALSRSQ